MSDERVFVSIKRDHIHQFNRLFALENGVWVAKPDELQAIAADMGNMIGAMHQAEEQQYPTAKVWKVRPIAPGTDDRWTGPLSPNSLDVTDWRVHAQNSGLWNRHDIFASTDVGATLAQDAGSMAQRVDLDTYRGAFSPWLVKE